jgi:hypothetical protein
LEHFIPRLPFGEERGQNSNLGLSSTKSKLLSYCYAVAIISKISNEMKIRIMSEGQVFILKFLHPADSSDCVLKVSEGSLGNF